MDPFNRKSAEITRKPVQGLSRRQSEDSDDQDSYELAAATVSDGFRPADLTPTDTSSSSTPNNPEIASPDSSQARLLTLNPSNQPQSSSASSKPPPTAPARPSSTAKPPRPHDSLTLRNDGSNSGQTGPSLSSSAGAPQLRPQSPYQGPTSASHPYQMYLQRTLSNATAATDPPANNRSYDGPRGPAHPYTLYPQNIATTGDETPRQIPVGFTTSADGYQRQLGPDGEEAGALVGPLGHTEELPPYSRYPDQTFASKTPAVTIPQDDPGETSSPNGAVTGAGGMGVATRNPEFSSTEEDLQHPESRPSDHSRHDINTAAQGSAEKTRMNKWQRRGKKKLWGIVPYWAICLLFIGVMLMGVILGAVIGTVLSHHKPRPSGGIPINNFPTPTPASDVIPLPTVPPTLPRLPVGNFELPPVFTSESPNTCINDHTQLAAWSCNLPSSYYQMNVDVSATASDTSCYSLTIKPINALDSQFLWGTQPPNFFDQEMLLVNDTLEPRRGPAWWLQVTYDKRVVIQEQDFSSQTKRWANPLGDHDAAVSKTASLGAKDGDKPWICTWPDTTLEIFIYPLQNTSTSPHPTSTATSTPNPTDGFHFYPKTVKFLERRVTGTTPKPFCHQVQVFNDGRSATNVTDSYGNPITVQIDENLYGQGQPYRHKRGGSVRRSWSDAWVTRQVYDLTPCACLWWSLPMTNPM